jgi:predicted dehydrogenase/pyruvate-formate lyase-activating enzyme
VAEVAGPLAEAIAAAKAAGVDASVDASSGIPACAVRDPSVLRLRRGTPNRIEACAPCALRDRCAGPAASYLDAHGARDLRPFASVPRELGAKKGRPVWDAAAREAAREIHFLVLRPTVHCNQDCLFCSANESSGEVWTDPGTMMRRIARAASRGLRRVSFSGGEPTLSPHLASFVEVARRCGVREVELVTNGVLLDREDKVDRLVRAGLTHAFVSLHAHDEELSSALTLKAGDHARTLRAIELFAARDVKTVINHVVTTRNAPFLERFVELARSRFGGRVLVSLALASPQFRALEHPELLPRLSEIAPLVRRALRRAVALEQPVVVGSRQGLPPCFLGAFRGWSDVLDLVAEAASEDAPQKEHGPACARCRYRRQCPGLWKPYVARHGTGELEPVLGEPFADGELDTIRRHHRRPPWGVPIRWGEVPDVLRDRALEDAAEPAAAAPRSPVKLPVVAARSRPIRVLLAGSGARARALAKAALAMPGLAIEAVASPHAPDADVPELANVPRYRSVGEALAEMRPEAVIVAAATGAHRALALEVIAARVPLLLEKPLARTLEEAEEIVRAAAASGGIALPAHQDVFALERVLAAEGEVRWTRRVSPDAPDMPRAWSRAALAQTLHHPIAALVRAAGGRDLEVVLAQHAGGGAPERIRARLRSGAFEGEIVIERAPVDELRVSRGGVELVRRSGATELRRGGTVERRPSAIESMLDALRRAVLGEAVALPPIADGVAAMRATRALIDALEEAGAPIDRAGAPKHASSPSLRDDLARRRAG